ncbi:MAG TPA: hypothetical protein VME69_12545 [Methylocella sp.]|nr:hypothetical protein [Methylocella sp.]
MLSEGFSPWQTCRACWSKWSTTSTDGHSLLEIALKKVVSAARQSHGKHEQTTLLIVDAQSVKNTGSAEQKGHDGGRVSI